MTADTVVQDAGKPGAVVSFPVFRDDKGNRFVFPGVNAYRERSIDWAQCRAICLALNVTEDKDRLEVAEDADGYLNFPHVKASAASRGFAHGGANVWLIGGPEFDAIARAQP